MRKYDDMQKNLLPSGLAWIRKAGSNLINLIAARSTGYDAVDADIIRLIDEVIPSTTDELLEEWERVCDLPDPALVGVTQTTAQRRANVLARLSASGSLSIAFLVAVAKNAGYDIEIEEFFGASGSLCGTAECGHAICGGDGTEWPFVFNVVSSDEFRVYALCGSARCGDRIAEYGDTSLQVTIGRYKPAHTYDVYNLYG